MAVNSGVAEYFERCMVTPAIIQQVKNMVECLVLIALNDVGAELSYMMGTGIIDLTINSYESNGEQQGVDSER